MFQGSREEADEFLRSIRGRYYVYLLARPDGTPFYIGKGINRRALEHEAEARRHHPIGETNPIKCNVIRKIISTGGTIIYKIDSDYDPTEQVSCLEREAFLISQHKRLHEGGCLTNLAGGIGNFAGAAPFSLAKHAATLSGEPSHNPERAILNRFLLGIGPVSSVPIKPASQIARVLPTIPHPQPRQPTPRCAYALVASAAASGLQFTNGAQIPRSFSYEGVSAVVENGVARDILKAGMANLISADDPMDERFQLLDHHVEVICRLFGRDALVQRGLI